MEKRGVNKNLHGGHHRMKTTSGKMLHYLKHKADENIPTDMFRSVAINIFYNPIMQIIQSKKRI